MTDQEKKELTEAIIRSHSNEEAIKELKEELHEVRDEQRAIHKIATSVEVIAERMVQIDTKVDMTNQKIDDQVEMWRKETERIEREEHELSTRIDAVESEPYKRKAKNANAIWIGVITAICTLAATTVFSSIMKLAFGGG